MINSIDHQLSIAFELLKRNTECTIAPVIAKELRKYLNNEIIKKTFSIAMKNRQILEIISLADEIVNRGIKISDNTYLKVLSITTSLSYYTIAKKIVKAMDDPSSFIRRDDILRKLTSDVIAYLLTETYRRVSKDQFIEYLLEIIHKRLSWLKFDKILSPFIKEDLLNKLVSKLDSRDILYILFRIPPTSKLAKKILYLQKSDSDLKLVYFLTRLLDRNVRLSYVIRLVEKGVIQRNRELANQLALWLLSNLNTLANKDVKSAVLLLRFLNSDVYHVLELLEKHETEREIKKQKHLPSYYWITHLLCNSIYHSELLFPDYLPVKQRNNVIKRINYKISFYRGRLQILRHSRLERDLEFMRSFLQDLNRNFSQLFEPHLCSYFYILVRLAKHRNPLTHQLVSIAKEKPVDPEVLLQAYQKMSELPVRRKELSFILNFKPPSWLATFLSFKLKRKKTTEILARHFPWSLILITEREYESFSTMDEDYKLSEIIHRPIILKYLLRFRNTMLFDILNLPTNHNNTREAISRKLFSLILNQCKFSNLNSLDRELNLKNTLFSSRMYFSLTAPYLPALLFADALKFIFHELLTKNKPHIIVSERLGRLLGYKEITLGEINYIEYAAKILASPFLDSSLFESLIEMSLSILTSFREKMRKFVLLLAQEIINNWGLHATPKLFLLIKKIPPNVRDIVLLSILRSNYPLTLKKIRKLIPFGENNSNYYCYLQHIFYKALLYGLGE